MGRLRNWIAGVLGGIGAHRLFKRWQSPAPATAPAAEEPDDRAEELRTKLAEARASDEPSPDESVEPPESLEERRRHVHEHGRSAIDEMQGGDEQSEI